jgi:hypothetical protein
LSTKKSYSHTVYLNDILYLCFALLGCKYKRRHEYMKKSEIETYRNQIERDLCHRMDAGGREA